ncbi:MAG: tetratricopeptide repeat protein, partial [Nitrospiraceae bacterium]
QTIDGYRWAYHAGDVLTDLDPQFVHAYQALGTVLAISAQQIDESISLLKKGMRHNPEAWVLPFLLGYAYYFERHDPGTASTYFQAAASLPGSPKYLPELAAKMTIEAGDPDAALEFLQRLYAQVPDERIREGLARRIKEVVVERDLRFLEEGIRRYRARSNKLPKKLEDLVTGGIINRIPDEPFGERYQLNETEGTVNSLALEKRFRLHRK